MAPRGCREVLVQVEENRSGQMGFTVSLAARFWVLQIEARVDDAQRRGGEFSI
jgi:hypothetical protein